MQMLNNPHQNTRQRGLTLVELLVSLALSLLVVAAAFAALLVARQGFTTVDSNSQMRDNARFSTELITRLVVQAGYQDLSGPAVLTRKATKDYIGTDPEPDLFGFNNALYVEPPDAIISEQTKITNSSRASGCATGSGTACTNGSDILVVRFQGMNNAAGTAADSSMINCSGQAEGAIVSGLDDRALSMLHVATQADGEPSLMCAYLNQATGNWVNQPLIRGVESFQVLYGVDGVTAGAAPSSTAVLDTVPELWLRADQLTVAGNLNATRENWRRVRAIRIGMVFRGATGTAQEVSQKTLYPLGEAFSSTSDSGSSLVVAADGRVRQAITFTVHLRNDQTTRL